MSQREYRNKRDFKKTPEPKGDSKALGKESTFVIQKHYAKRLHYDFRLAVGEKLISWAIPKGLSKRTADKRLAIHTEDHPLEYAKFEGKIPEGEYGAGKVEIFDKGTYYNLSKSKAGRKVSLRRAFKNGHIEVILEGEKFKGAYALIHFRDENWLIIKMKVKVDG